MCAALRERGHIVQPFKKGPDFIDPIWLGRAAGRSCVNLDFYTMGRDEIATAFASAMQGAGIGLIEGNKGLYDGLDLDGSNSNAALAAHLGSPVVLVLDARGMTRGIAPLILGYQAFEPTLRIAGVILNRLGGARHEAKLRAVIAHYTDVPVLGAIMEDHALGIAERHLGLIPGNEAAGADETIRQLAARVRASVDLDAVLDVARTAAVVPVVPAASPVSMPGGRVRIGIARDSAFGFYYPGDLDALERSGAELVCFDTLRDRRLPAVDGLFIGGGFPETHMAALAANAALRHAVRVAVEGGLPAYAECGGLMYLARSLAWKGRVSEMAGVLPLDIVMHDRPQGRGYVRLQATPDHPWPGAGAGAEIPAHEFHYSGVDQLPQGLRFAWRVLRGYGIDGQHDGLVMHNLLASYVHLRDVAAYHWAGHFVEFVRNMGRQSHTRRP